MGNDRPQIDDRNPADAVSEMVERVLELAATWVAWDGHPRPVDDRIYTPHKSIRRVTDHMIDHLAQLEAHLAGITPVTNDWHGSSITTKADMASFAPEDLEEARSRLRRLAVIWAIRLASVPESALDRPREMAFCVVGSNYYAEAIGALP